MGLVLCVLSNIMYLSEKFTMCLAAATVVSCLVLTLVMMLGLGVGLGYNYCFVEIKTKHRHVPGHYRYKVKEATTMQRTPPWRRLITTRITTINTKNASRLGLVSQVDNRKQLIDYSPPTLDEMAKDGYNNYKIKPSTEINSNEDGSNSETETDEAKSETSDGSENTDTSTTSKTVLQIQGLDLIALLSKLKSENRNYTIQIITS